MAPAVGFNVSQKLANFLCRKCPLVLCFVWGQCFSNRVYGIAAGSESGYRQFEDARHGPFGFSCDRRAVVLGYPLQHLKDVSGGYCFDRHFANSWENGPLQHLEPLGLGDFLPVFQCQPFLGDSLKSDSSLMSFLDSLLLTVMCWIDPLYGSSHLRV